MKKLGVLNHRLSDVIAMMGHGDMLVVADAGLPIPPGVERIDLAVSNGIPSMLDVIAAIASELQVERLVVATELIEKNSALNSAVVELFPGAPVSDCSHDDFKRMSERAKAVVRTGECTPYANVILVSGVIF